MQLLSKDVARPGSNAEALMRGQHRYGRQSWKPWLLSLLVDVASSHLSSSGAKVAQRHIDADGVKPGLSTSGSMLLLYSLDAFRWGLHSVQQRCMSCTQLLQVFGPLLVASLYPRLTRSFFCYAIHMHYIWYFLLTVVLHKAVLI